MVRLVSYEGHPVPHPTPESECAAMKLRQAAAAVDEAAEAMSVVDDMGKEWPARYRDVTKTVSFLRGIATDLERRNQ